MDADDDEEGPPLPPGTKNYMTPAGHARLREELHALWVLERPKVVEIVSWAAGNGDRSENGDYQYGKKPQRDRVFFGATVTFVNSRDEERTVTVLGVDEAEITRGEVSLSSPIARALLRARVGEAVRMMTPGGWEEIEILEVRYPEVAAG
jgi:transcription elongation factor GreB